MSGTTGIRWGKGELRREDLPPAMWAAIEAAEAPAPPAARITPAKPDQAPAPLGHRRESAPRRTGRWRYSAAAVLVAAALGGGWTIAGPSGSAPVRPWSPGTARVTPLHVPAPRSGSRSAQRSARSAAVTPPHDPTPRSVARAVRPAAADPVPVSASPAVPAPSATSAAVAQPSWMLPRYTGCTSTPTLFDARRWRCIGIGVPTRYTDNPAVAEYLTTTWRPTPSCPAPLSGRLAGAGDRIPLELQLTGPRGVRMLPAFLDTGAGVTTLPASVLADVGLSPYGSSLATGIVPGASAAVYSYHLPPGALSVWHGGTPELLTPASLSVVGVPGGTLALVGPDVLKSGASLSVDGPTWILWPACSGR